MARKLLGVVPNVGDSSNKEAPTSWITSALNLKLDKTGLSASTPLSYNSGTGALSIQAASTTQDGYLSSANFNTFNNKENAITGGTTSQYWRGDKSWQDLPSAIRSTVLTGLVAGTNQAITATDSILTAMQNLQAQVASKLGSTAQATDSDKLDGQHGSYYQTALGFTPLKNTTDTFAGDLTLSAGSLYLPATGFSGAGPIQSTIAIKFANGSGAQEAYMQKLRLGGTWSTLDSNDPGVGGIYASGTIKASSFVKSGGTGSQFLKADGSVDSSSYESTITAGTTSQYYRGDKTWQALDTAAVTESTNLYFTNARVLGTVLTGLNTSLTGAVVDSDTILAAIGKLENRVAGFSATAGVGSFAGIKVTGVAAAAGASTCWLDASGGGRIAVTGANSSSYGTFGIEQYSSDLSLYRRVLGISADGVCYFGGPVQAAGAFNSGLTGANVITSYLTTGASDGNFRLISANGVGITGDSEQAWLGLAYGSTRLAGISFIRGASADASIQFTTNANTTALTLGIDGTATFASSISAPSTTIGRRIHISDNNIEERGTNAVSGLAFNYSGYNGGTTQFRNFDVYNGKNGLVLNITGSSKAATFSGSVSASSLAVTNSLIDSSGISISDGDAYDRYARLTLTRSFTTGTRQYISLIKSGTYPWGIGMNASGSLIFGEAKPGVDSQFAVNKLELTTSGDLSVPGKMYGTGLSTGWGTGTSGVGAFNAIMGTSPSAATWLLMGTSGGVRRCGIQASDSDGTMRLFTGSGSGYVTIDTSGGITALGALTAGKVVTTGNGTAGGIVLRNPSGVSYRLSINSSNQLQLDAI